MSPPEYHNDSNDTSDNIEDDSGFGVLIGVRLVGAPLPLIHAIGLHPAIYLNECIYWQEKVGDDGWFSRTIPQMQADTGLTKSEQAVARKSLRGLDLIEERKGVGFRTKTRIDREAFRAMIGRISAVQKSAAEIQRVKNQPLKSEQLAGQKSAASRPEISGSYNNTKHIKHTETSSVEDDDFDLPIIINHDEILSVAQPNPFTVWSVYCNARGLPLDHLIGDQRQIQLNHAKLILKDRITLEEVKSVTIWLLSDPWWVERGFDLNQVRKQYARWVSSGRPTRTKAPGSKAIRGTTPSI